MGKNFSCIANQEEKDCPPEAVSKTPKCFGKGLKNTFFGGKYSPSVGIAYTDSTACDISSKINIAELFLASSFRAENQTDKTHEEDAVASKSLTEIARDFITRSRSNSIDREESSRVRDEGMVVHQTESCSESNDDESDSIDSLTTERDIDHSDIDADVESLTTDTVRTEDSDAESEVDKERLGVVNGDKTLRSVSQTRQFEGTEHEGEISPTGNLAVPLSAVCSTKEALTHAVETNTWNVRAISYVDKGGGTERNDKEMSPVSRTSQFADTKEVVSSSVILGPDVVERDKKPQVERLVSREVSALRMEARTKKLLEVDMHNKIGLFMKNLAIANDRAHANRDRKAPNLSPVPVPPTDHTVLRKEISLLPMVSHDSEDKNVSPPVQVHPNDIMRLACLNFMRSMTTPPHTPPDCKLTRAVSVPTMPGTSVDDKKKHEALPLPVVDGLCRSAMSTPKPASSAITVIQKSMKGKEERSLGKPPFVTKKVSDFPAPKIKRTSSPLALHLLKIPPKHMYSVPNVAKTDIQNKHDMHWKQVESKSPKAQMPWTCRSPRFDVVFPPLGERLFKRMGSIESMQRRKIIPQVKSIEIIKLENSTFPGLRVYNLRKGRHKYNFNLPRQDDSDDDTDDDDDET